MGDATVPVQVSGLQVRYGAHWAVREVSFTVPAGGVYALLGRNGAGKSSIVRCLLGQQRASGGRVWLLGADPWRRRATLMRRVGVVPEEPDAPPALSTRQLTAWCARLYRGWDAGRVAERLRRFAVPVDVPFGSLSKGQKAQVMLALALGHRPELLVLDDPTLGLDAVARRALYEELVDELADRATTVLLTTHDLTAVEGIASHVGVLAAGEMLVDEPLESLKARFRRLRLASSALATPQLDQLGVVTSRRGPWGLEVVVSRLDEEGAARLAASGAVAVETMNLEEIFVTLVGNGAGGAA